MKAIVTLRKTYETIVVVEGKDEEEIDNNLLKGKVLFQSKADVKTSNTYLGMEYIDHRIADGQVITSAEEFYEEYCGENNMARARKSLFKYTKTGLDCIPEEDGIHFYTCVEGADCDGPDRKLFYPFTMNEAYELIQELDDEAAEMWYEWNEEDGEETDEEA